MTSTHPTTDSTAPPEYPMPRASGCPFAPAPQLHEEQRQGPLRRVRLSDGSTPWLVTRHAEQRAVLSDPRVSTDPRNPGYPSPEASAGARQNRGSSLSFILMDDPEHARLRRMVTAAFTVKRVARLRPRIQQIVDDAIDTLLAGPTPADLVSQFALPVPSLVICELLGVPYADHDFFQDNSKLLIARDTGADERAAASTRLAEYLDGLLEQKLAAPQEDLLSDLAERVTAGELPRGEAARMGVLLLVAGHETTANMIALGTLVLLQHPDQLETLRTTDDPAVVSAAVEELLRYLTITHNGRRRTALEDIEIAGETIHAGEGIIVPNEMGNRDPEVFDDPQELDIGRDSRRHLAFGFGVHQCLGQPLARLELHIVAQTLYRRIPTLRLAADFDDIPFKHDGFVYGVYELPVTW